MKRWSRLAAVSLLSVAAGACDAEYKEIDLQIVTSPPSDAEVSISSKNIQVPVGVAVAVNAKPISKKYDYDSDDKLSVESRNEAIFRVEKTLEKRMFVMWGANPGKTCMAVLVNGKEKDCVDVTVR